MAIRTVVKLGDEILRAKSREAVVFDERLSSFIDDLIDTMKFEDGVGLAAPQVGVLKRVCVVSPDGETVYELINPVIIKREGSQVTNEGCLSIPGRQGEVERPKTITVRYRDRTGAEHLDVVSDFTAVIFSHEIDHLDGILYIDRMAKK